MGVLPSPRRYAHVVAPSHPRSENQTELRICQKLYIRCSPTSGGWQAGGQVWGRSEAGSLRRTGVRSGFKNSVLRTGVRSLSPERTPYWDLEIELRTGLAKFRTPYWSTEFSKSWIFKIPDSGLQSGILLRTHIPYSSTGRRFYPPPLSFGGE